MSRVLSSFETLVACLHPFWIKISRKCSEISDTLENQRRFLRDRQANMAAVSATSDYFLICEACCAQDVTKTV